MIKNEVNQLSPFPDILATKEKKSTPAYGLQYVKAIWGSHLNNSLRYNDQRSRDIINRTYAAGNESIEKFKTRKGITNTSYLNLDFSPVNIIATTVDNMVGRLSNTEYKIQCNAIDPESKSKFDDYRSNLYADMFLKPLSDQVEQLTGIPLVAKNKKIPETSEEAELHMKMNYKDDASIAMEEAFNYVFSSNMFDTSREAIIRDLLEIKRTAIQRKYDEDWNIKVERIDVVDVITPYSKYDDFRNIPWVAVMKNYTIGELAVMNPKFTDQELYEIAKRNAGQWDNPIWNYSNSYEGYYSSTNFSTTAPYYNFNIQTLEFYFLGLDNEVREFKSYKKRKYLNKVNESFVSKDDNSELISRKVQNVYEGQWIVGTDHVFNYKMCYNIPREKINGSYSSKANLPIKIIAPGIYDMKNKSHVERMIPHEDAINLANLAFQTLIIKMKPPGVAIDVRGLLDAAKALGSTQTPMDVVKMYEQTGNFIFSSIGEENDVINSRVITELKGGIGEQLQQLITFHQFKRNEINEVIGYNTAVDASSPNKEALVGVQKFAIQATNNSLKPIFNAHLRLIEAVSKDIALMIQDCIEFENEAFTNAIGTYATKTLEYGKKLAFVQMGIKIELLPDEDEKMQIDEQIRLGQMSNPPLLMPSDVIRIRAVLREDVKLAAKLLVHLEEKNRKNRMKEAQALSEQNGQVQVQSAQAAAQANSEVQAQADASKAELIKLQGQIDSDLSAQEHRQIMEQLNSKNQTLLVVQDKKNEGAENIEHVAGDHKFVSEALKHSIPKEEKMEL